ncbi:MAG: response regulator [Snowella sp.]|nr:response regulator [Snowella sp.]
MTAPSKTLKIPLAHSKQETITFAKIHKSDLILINLQMPNLKGLKVITPMRSDVAIAGIPIVAITDLALPEEAEKYIVVGASECISRPVQLKKRAEIVHICRRHDKESR